ncbi:MAG TPA: hypothetical protein DCQ46_01145 [Lachnospiraceae bacterium]|nr:hypothetical protein [Lachnospiraceae bacterium]
MRGLKGAVHFEQLLFYDWVLMVFRCLVFIGLWDYGIDYNIEKENFANAKKILAIFLSVIREHSIII